MRFIHDQKVIDAYPGNFTGIITVKGFTEVSKLKQETEKLEALIKEVISTDQMEKAISDWQATFSKMGAKPKYKSSLTAAYDFYKSNNRLYQINPIVDFYNHYGLVKMVPMGAYDLPKVKGNLHLIIAEKGMEFVGIGSKEIQKTKENEIIYKDDERVTCRYWNLKDSDFTKITDKTQDMVFMFDMIKDDADQAKNTFDKVVKDFKYVFKNTFDKSGLTGKGLIDTLEL
jgi:DNA/RNA-binding domain of Phe-tRNA-synthetase-like protein